MNRELPAMSNSAYASNSYNPVELAAGLTMGSNVGLGVGVSPLVLNDASLQLQGWQQQTTEFDWAKIKEQARRQAEEAAKSQNPKRKRKEPSMTTRMVQIFIVDPHTSVPLTDRLVYRSSEPFLTDLDDQELFFDLDIKQLLANHNAKRTAVVNKGITDRTVNLEAARVRDLRMNVTVVAQF